MPEHTNPLAAFLPQADTTSAKPKPVETPGWLTTVLDNPFPSAGAYALTVGIESPDGDTGLSRTDRSVVLVAAVQADLALNSGPDGYAGITIGIVARTLGMAEASVKQVADRLVRLGALGLNDARTTDGSKLYTIPSKVIAGLVG